MPNITLAVPEELHEKMKKHSEIRWSEVARKAISQKMEDLETMDRIAAKSRLTQKDADEITKKVNSNVARKLGLK
ncbi:MAG: hypothetical protein HY051_05250 [Candidatus Aenigmarchaeota archaeon]|nr:hypothetical protein [Candidatus Aenigmarchaeota archaeon]